MFCLLTTVYVYSQVCPLEFSCRYVLRSMHVIGSKTQATEWLVFLSKRIKGSAALVLNCELDYDLLHLLSLLVAIHKTVPPKYFQSNLSGRSVILMWIKCAKIRTGCFNC